MAFAPVRRTGDIDPSGPLSLLKGSQSEEPKRLFNEPLLSPQTALRGDSCRLSHEVSSSEVEDGPKERSSSRKASTCCSSSGLRSDQVEKPRPVGRRCCSLSGIESDLRLKERTQPGDKLQNPRLVRSLKLRADPVEGSPSQPFRFSPSSPSFPWSLWKGRLMRSTTDSASLA